MIPPHLSMCSEKNQIPRVRRRIFTLIAAVSLLLFIATVTLIVCSFYYQKGWEKGVRLSRLEAQSHRHDIREGRIYFKTARQSFEQYSAGAEYRLNLQGTADAQVCPASLPAGYDTFVGTDDGKVQTCQGGSHNSWYGNGQVDAFNAVTHGV